MKRIALLLFTLLTCQSVLHAAGDYRALGGAAFARANAALSLHDVFSFQNNPAGLAWLKTPTVACASQMSSMQFSLTNNTVILAYPVKKAGCLATGASYFGDPNYHELHAGLAYARCFAEQVSVGIRLDYLQLGISTYGTQHSASFHLGLQYLFRKKLTVACHVYNPLHMKLSKEKTSDHFQTLFQLGFQYKPLTQFDINVEAEKDLQQAVNIKIGLAYRPINVLSLGVGAQTRTRLICFGTGIFYKGFQMDIACSWHYVLGFSPQCSLIYEWKNTKKP